MWTNGWDPFQLNQGSRFFLNKYKIFLFHPLSISVDSKYWAWRNQGPKWGRNNFFSASIILSLSLSQPLFQLQQAPKNRLYTLTNTSSFTSDRHSQPPWILAATNLFSLQMIIQQPLLLLITTTTTISSTKMRKIRLDSHWKILSFNSINIVESACDF